MPPPCPGRSWPCPPAGRGFWIFQYAQVSFLHRHSIPRDNARMSSCGPLGAQLGWDGLARLTRDSAPSVVGCGGKASPGPAIAGDGQCVPACTYCLLAGWAARHKAWPAAGSAGWRVRPMRNCQRRLLPDEQGGGNPRAKRGKRRAMRLVPSGIVKYAPLSELSAVVTPRFGRNHPPFAEWTGKRKARPVAGEAARDPFRLA